MQTGTIPISTSKTIEPTGEWRTVLSRQDAVRYVEREWICREDGERFWRRIPEVVTQDDGTTFTRG